MGVGQPNEARRPDQIPTGVAMMVAFVYARCGAGTTVDNRRRETDPRRQTDAERLL
jgi:hypothetical protein